MIKEAIILAGGLGTRLREAVPQLPKCMAPVNGKPFIGYVIDHLQKQGIEKFIFALGYKSEFFETFLQSLSSLHYQLSTEQEPLGTGGAIKLACSISQENDVLVANGDTLFNINLEKLSTIHETKDAECTLCLKPMKKFDRYGVVEMNDSGVITSFKEKKFYESGLINGGVYALNKPGFINKKFPDKFSFEKDYLETYYTQQKMYGLIQDEYFIDIGIPEDYGKAQLELK